MFFSAKLDESDKRSKAYRFYLLLFLLFISGSLSAAFSLREIPDSIGPDGRNISRQFFQFLKVAALKNKYDGRAVEFHKYLDRSLERFELKNLYNSEFMQKEMELIL